MGKKKILVIDDEERFTELIKLNLEGSGDYEVRTENRGKHGLQAALEFKPDLILLDVLMGDLDGSKVALQIEKNEETKDIPIVYVTGLMSKEDEDPLQNVLGGRPFLAKPITTGELINCIEKNLKKND